MIAITGASGHIGRLLTAELAARTDPAQVRLITPRSSMPTPTNTPSCCGGRSTCRSSSWRACSAPMTPCGPSSSSVSRAMLLCWPAAPSPTSLTTSANCLTAYSTDPKDAVLASVTAVFDERRVREGFESFARTDYIQHNPGLGDGPEPAIAYLTALLDFRPEMKAMWRHSIAEGDHVVVTSSLSEGGGPATAVLVDIFRVQDGLVAEH